MEKITIDGLSLLKITEQQHQELHLLFRFCQSWALSHPSDELQLHISETLLRLTAHNAAILKLISEAQQKEIETLSTHY